MFSRATVRKSQDPCCERLVVCKESNAQAAAEAAAEAAGRAFRLEARGLELGPELLRGARPQDAELLFESPLRNVDAKLQAQRGRVGPKPERSDEPKPPGAGNASVDLEDTP